MPEFELDHGPREAATRYKSLDPFTQGYVECMFFCGFEDSVAESMHLGLLADDTWQQIKTDCEAFQLANAAVLAAATDGEPIWPGGSRFPYTMTRAGHDYWYTRNGHGVGYGDRGLPADVETELERAATVAGQVDAYVGDDGKVYL